MDKSSSTKRRDAGAMIGLMSVIANAFGMIPGAHGKLMDGGFVQQEGMRRRRRRKKAAVKAQGQFRGKLPYIDPIGRFPTVGAWAKAKGLCKS